MDFSFVDDARQPRPSRRHIGPLVGVGGVYVAAAQVPTLEREIGLLCRATGFPDGQEFKWSPGKRQPFMKTSLHGDARLTFYRELFQLASAHNASFGVVIEDTRHRPARKVSSCHENDVTSLFLERANLSLKARGVDGIVIIAQPGGGTGDTGKLVSTCIDLLRAGTEYSKLDKFPLGIVIARASQIRLLQLADIVASCVLARVAGESNHSPQVFELIRPLLQQENGRTAGIGLKLHPDYVLANLYYWLLAEQYFFKRNWGFPLPLVDQLFASNSGECSVDLQPDERAVRLPDATTGISLLGSQDPPALPAGLETEPQR